MNVKQKNLLSIWFIFMSWFHLARASINNNNRIPRAEISEKTQYPSAPIDS